MRAISLLFHDVYVGDPAESGFQSAAADRYKLSLAEFDAQLDGVAQVRQEAPVTALAHAAGDSASSGPDADPPGRPVPFLITFDDGGVSYHTLIADRLEARGWRGVCFVSTDYLGSRGFLTAAQLRELDARGHVIGSHSASHPTRFSACSYEQMVREWSSSRAALEDILGHRVDVASVPGGYFSPAVARAAHDAGVRVLFNSEPVTGIGRGSGCLVAGRFTIRQGDAPGTARQLVLPSPRARWQAWLAWNAKGLIKPLLGPSYVHAAGWVHALRRSARERASARAFTHSS